MVFLQNIVASDDVNVTHTHTQKALMTDSNTESENETQCWR